MPAVSERRTILVILAMLAMLAAVPYVQTLRHDFVSYDDNEFITENPRVQQGLTIENVKWAFASTTASNWHPITMLSHMLDVELWRLRPGGHHLTNVILHAANTLILFLALRRLTGAMWRSALVAALFAIHPLHVESVAWVAERKDVLSTFFGFLALWCYDSYVQQRTIGRYAIVAMFFVLSLMSKPMLVTLPFVMLLLDVWPLQRTTRQSRVWLIAEKIPLLALSAGVSAITLVSQRATDAVFSVDEMGILHRIENAVVAYAMYLAKMAWPVDLVVLYPLQRTWPMHEALISAVALLAISAAAVMLRRSRPYLLVGWLFFLGTLVPVIGFVRVGFQSMADRYTYVPLIGVFIMIAWSLPTALANTTRVRLVTTAAGVVILALAARTWHQIGYWRDSFTLFSHAIETTDGNFIAHNNLGYAYAKAGDLPRAIHHYITATELCPTYGVAFGNLGAAYLMTGQHQAALPPLQRAVQLLEHSSRIRTNLGTALVANGQPDAAIDAYQRAIDLDPTNPDPHYNLARTLTNLKRIDEAIIAYQRVLQLRPNHADAQRHLELARRLQRDEPQ